MFASISEIEDRLWQMADKLRANTHLRAHEYSEPVLGLIFLRFAYETFKKADREIRATFVPTARRPQPDPDMYLARGAIYLPADPLPGARYPDLLRLTTADEVEKALNNAMTLIEQYNENLTGALPKTSYSRLDRRVLLDLLRGFDNATLTLESEEDMFGRIYEYFLGKFALSEGQRGGEFFTPTSLVRLIVEVIEPFEGLIFDPACGSGGMFVQSARFVRNHQGDPGRQVSIYGQEKTLETVRLCKMNLAVHGLPGDIRNANSYYDDPHNCSGRFDYVMANPPFNVNGIDKTRLNMHHFPFGLPRVDNGNYIWIQLFYTALSERGRAGFVMPNQASSASGSEQEIRRKLIETGVVDVMIAIASNFFYTVTLPCTLWFFDKGKRQSPHRDTVLFIDARHIFRQVDRAHREFWPEDIEFIANIVRLYRGEQPETAQGSARRLEETFPTGSYVDVPGLCKVATLAEIKAQGWSLNPGRYVGVAERAIADFDFKEKLEALNEELETLNAEAHDLEERISENINKLLDEMGD
ncbi:MAG: N-6 DNA methylase [Ktedonobacteraceae bacterium]|nr:N-6 DNA methylase [Ktedonobacteraceae bacterium]